MVCEICKKPISLLDNIVGRIKYGNITGIAHSECAVEESLNRVKFDQ